MKLKHFLALPLASLVVAGCTTTQSSEVDVAASETTVTTTVTEPVAVTIEPLDVQEPVVVPVAPPIPAVLNSVEFISPELDERVAVTHTTYDRTPSRAFRVLCTLRNLTNEPIRLQARTQYFTEDRMHQEGPGAWQLVFLPANGIETYTSYSYGTNLSYYFVEVQEM